MSRLNSNTVVIAAGNFVVLLLLWLAFVSSLHRMEVYAGVAAAVIASIAELVVRQTGFARFRPTIRDMALLLWQPWYVLSGTAALFGSTLKQLLGKGSDSEFKAIRFDAGGDDTRSVTRRVLATTYTTIPPDSIVIGIDRKKHLLFLHQIAPAPTAEVTKRLGARE